MIDTSIYNFSDYAEEIKGDALFKINGDVIVLKQIDIDIANEKLGNNGNDGTGNTNGNSGTSHTSTSESTPEVPEEINAKSLQINTPEKCAKKWAEKYLYESIESDKEYGSKIYKTTDINGNLIYKYTDPNMGSSHSCNTKWSRKII